MRVILIGLSLSTLNFHTKKQVMEIPLLSYCFLREGTDQVESHYIRLDCDAFYLRKKPEKLA